LRRSIFLQQPLPGDDTCNTTWQFSLDSQLPIVTLTAAQAGPLHFTLAWQGSDPSPPFGF
jgi:hypothetical protein